MHIFRRILATLVAFLFWFILTLCLPELFGDPVPFFNDDGITDYGGLFAWSMILSFSLVIVSALLFVCYVPVRGVAGLWFVIFFLACLYFPMIGFGAHYFVSPCFAVIVMQLSALVFCTVFVFMSFTVWRTPISLWSRNVSFVYSRMKPTRFKHGFYSKEDKTRENFIPMSDVEATSLKDAYARYCEYYSKGDIEAGVGEITSISNY